VCKRAKDYIKSVSTGKTPVGKWIKLAVRRHLSDLKKSKEKKFEYRFDEAEANRIIEFFEMQRFTTNQMAGQPFTLLPWQCFVLWCAYGWRRKKDGYRRFVKVVLKIPRGNGKTEFLAGVGNVAMLCEEERDPEVYWIATKKSQANIGWGRQKRMIESLRTDFPEVAAMVDTKAHSIYEINGAGFSKYLGRDSKSEDGLSPYYYLADEKHAWVTNEMEEIMESGMVKRRRPMGWVITTEGFRRDGPWDELESNCHAMLNGTIPQDEVLAILYDLDEGDDWKDPKNWPKVNPSLGVSVSMITFESQFKKAIAEGLSSETSFKVKNLNIKVRSGHGWIRDEDWQACPTEMPDLTGQVCYGGIDLSSTSDFSSLCLLFPDAKEEEHRMKWWNWLPEEAFLKRARKFPIFYEWEKAGFIRVIPGNYIDYDEIRAVVNDACKDYQVKIVGCDPANAWQLVGNLQNDGVGIEMYPMSWANVSEPCKQLARLFGLHKINHGGNPVIRWMLQNVLIKKDNVNGNVRPDKGKSVENIDGIIAAIIALGQYYKYRPKTTGSYLFQEGAELIIK
jgi:phage terminase large subunit-like protein